MDNDYLMADESGVSAGSSSSSQSTGASFVFSTSAGDTSASSYDASGSSYRALADKGKGRAHPPAQASSEDVASAESSSEQAVSPPDEPIAHALEVQQEWNEAQSPAPPTWSLINRMLPDVAKMASRMPVSSARQAQHVSYPAASSTGSSTRNAGSGLTEHDHTAIFSGLHLPSSSHATSGSTSVVAQQPRSADGASSSIKRTFSQAEITSGGSPTSSPNSPASSLFPSQRRFYSNRIAHGDDDAAASSSASAEDSIMAELDRHGEERARESRDRNGYKRLRPDHAASRSVSREARGGGTASRSGRSVRFESSDDSHLMSTVDHLANDSATSTSIFPPALGSLGGSTSARQPLRFRETASSSTSNLPASLRTAGLPESVRTAGMPGSLRTTLPSSSSQLEPVVRSSSSSSGAEWSWQRRAEQSAPTASAVANSNWAEASSSAIAATLFGSNLTQRWTPDSNLQTAERARPGSIQSRNDASNNANGRDNASFDSVLADLEVPSLPPWATLPSMSSARAPGGEADWSIAFAPTRRHERNWMPHDADAPSSSSTGGSTGHGDASTSVLASVDARIAHLLSTVGDARPAAPASAAQSDAASAISTSVDAAASRASGLRIARLRSAASSRPSSAAGSEAEADRDQDGDVMMHSLASGSSNSTDTSSSASTVPRRAQFISTLRSARERERPNFDTIQADLDEAVGELRGWRDRNGALMARIRRREAAAEALLDPQRGSASASAATVARQASLARSLAATTAGDGEGEFESSFESAMRRFAELDAADRRRETAEVRRPLPARLSSRSSAAGVGSGSSSRSRERMVLTSHRASLRSTDAGAGLWGEMRSAAPTTLGNGSTGLAQRRSTRSSTAAASSASASARRAASAEPTLSTREADSILRRPGALDSSGRLRGPTRRANQSWMGLGDDVDRAANSELASSSRVQPRRSGDVSSREVRLRREADRQQRVASLLDPDARWSSSRTDRAGDAPVAVGAPQLPLLRARSPLVMPFASSSSSAAPSSNATQTSEDSQSRRAWMTRERSQGSGADGASTRSHLRPLTLSSRTASTSASSSSSFSLSSSINLRSHLLLDSVDDDSSSSSTSSSSSSIGDGLPSPLLSAAADAARHRANPYLFSRLPRLSGTHNAASDAAAPQAPSISSYLRDRREPGAVQRDADVDRRLGEAAARSAALNQAARAARRQPAEMREPAPAPSSHAQREAGRSNPLLGPRNEADAQRAPWVGLDAPILTLAGSAAQRRTEAQGVLGVRRSDVNERIDSLATQVRETRQRRLEATMREALDGQASVSQGHRSAVEALFDRPAGSSYATLAARTQSVLEDAVARARATNERERQAREVAGMPRRSNAAAAVQEQNAGASSAAASISAIAAEVARATSDAAAAINAAVASSRAARRLPRFDDALFFDDDGDQQFNAAHARLRIAREHFRIRAGLSGIAGDPNNYLGDAEWATHDSYEDLLRLSARVGEVISKNTPTRVIESLPTCTYSVWLGGSCADSALPVAAPSEDAFDPHSKGKGVDRSDALQAAAVRALEERAAASCRDAHCPICLDEYEPSSLLRSAPCKHAFHSDCLTTWLKGHRTCPLCRSDVAKEAAKFSSTAGDFGLPLLPELGV